MSEVVPSGSKYTDQDRRQAAIQYAIEGNLSQIERDTGIPNETLSYWKSNNEAWAETVARVREETDDKVLAEGAKIIELAQARTIEAMPDATALQAATIGGIWIDKTRLIRNQPTSIRGDSSTVQSLMAEFQKLSQDHKNIQGSVVSTQDATHDATHDKVTD